MLTFSQYSFLIVLSVFLLATPLPAQENNRPSVGLVLSGGGAKGLAHIGALKVLEEAGIHIDYIAGTSMGSIIGGMYAIGYSPDYMEEVIGKQDWEQLLQDKVPRSFLSYEEKQIANRFITTFPISQKGVELRRGIYSGQNIETLLSGLTSPVYDVSNFKDFQTPFLCIATDLVTGEEVILENGDLARAMRGSMAIPSFFTPIKYQNRLLVDGGVINNYPANRLKERGIDIIIGIDVQDSIRGEDNLNSIVNIIDQITSFYRWEANNQGKMLTDYYIRPNLTEYNILSFEAADSIISRGEKAARKMLPELRKLADSINNLGQQSYPPQSVKPLDSILIKKIKIIGLQNISKNLVLGKLNLTPNEWHYLPEVQAAIKRVYGTRFFEKINFQFLPFEGGSLLVVDVIENRIGELGAGININSDYNTSLLLNATFRNVGIGGSKLFVDGALSDMPRFRALYLYDLGNKPGFGLNIDWHSFAFNDYNNKGDKENRYDVTNFITDIFTQISLKNSFVFGLKGQFKLARIENDFPTADTNFFFLGGGDFHPFLGISAYLKIDTRDKNKFSTQGFELESKIKRISNLDRDEDLARTFGSATTYFFEYMQNAPVSPKSTIKLGLVYAGTAEKDLSLLTDWYMLGGQMYRHYSDNFIPFTGLNLIERLGRHASVARFRYQYEVGRKQYLTLLFDMGNTALRGRDMLNANNFIFGYGLSYGVESFIGPLELSLMGSNTSPQLKVFVNIGYWF